MSSSEDKSLISTVTSGVVGFGRDIASAVTNFGSKYALIDRFQVDRVSPKVCLQCHCSVGQGGRFCSQFCGMQYWREFQEYSHRTSGHRICSYPGCNKWCYVEQDTGRVHDYCNRTHADQHKAMRDQVWRQHWEKQKQQHHGGSHQSTKSKSGHSSWWWSWGNNEGPINFYDRDDPYYEFTNFYYAPINLDGKMWPTSEHYFQAQKFVGTPFVEQIRQLSRPREAFDFTRDPKVSYWRRNDWERIKEDVMYKALLAKFTQHYDLRKMLLETRDRKLIEHSPYDSYWGDGGDGKGKNRLGVLLVKLRSELQRGQKGKKGASNSPLSHAQQETTSEHLQHSSQCGEGKDSPPGMDYSLSSAATNNDDKDYDSHDQPGPLPSHQGLTNVPNLIEFSQTLPITTASPNMTGPTQPSNMPHTLNQVGSPPHNMSADCPPPGFGPPMQHDRIPATTNGDKMDCT